MQNEWQKFLESQGAHFDENAISRFTENAREDIQNLASNNQLASLDHLGALSVSGEDAQAFLQAQLSNDINQTHENEKPTRAQISAYCNPKGRILAQFLIVPTAAGYYLIAAKDLLQKTLMRLRMFVLRSKVSIEDVSNEIVLMGFMGPKLQQSGVDLPTGDYTLQPHESGFIVSLPSSGIARYMLICPLAEAPAVWVKLAEHASPASADTWQWLDIQAGQPSVVAATHEEFVPQMLNLELINGVNFKKGCYPGQEIVARMHYLGKPKRRMFRLSADVDEPVPAGTHLYLHNGDGQSAGIVVNSQPSPAKGIDLLAVIRLNHAGSDQLRLQAQDGASVAFKDLPYPLETAE